MGTTQFSQYERTNLSFEEVFDGEYDLPLKDAPATVLDIGGNEGAFTAWATQKWPQAVIHAYEPVPENAELFRKNHKDNSKVVLTQKAVALDGSVRLFYGKHNSGECSMFAGDSVDCRSVVVEGLHPSKLPSYEFVKVDTEGAEVDIICNLNLDNTKAIAFEYHRKKDAEKLAPHLESLGFDCIEHKMDSSDSGTMKYAKPGTVIVTPPKPKSPVKVFIAVPSYFHIDPYFHRCMLQTYGWLATQPDVPGAIHGEVSHTFGDSPNVGRSRNMLTRLFLESDCTDLLFIDSDLVFSVEHVKRILSHDEDVVGGLYFKKAQGKAEACLNTIKKPIIKPNGLNQVAYIGTGFMRIKRCVFEEIIARWGDEIAYCPDETKDLIEYNFWNLAMNTFDSIKPTQDRIDGLVKKYGVSEARARKAISTRWLSEDWWFCQRCMDLGIRVWADRRIALKHSGNVLYPLLTQERDIFGEQVIFGTPGSDSTVAATHASPREPVTV